MTAIKVLERFALMGPNLHAHHAVIKWKLDIGPLEERPSNEIDGFVDTLKTTIPSLIEHRCSEGVRGGFFQRLESGTWAGHVMEHVALEIQNLAGGEVGFGRARSAGPTGVYNVIYECLNREVGIEAGVIALDLIEHLVSGEPFDFEARLDSIRTLSERRQLGPSTRSIVDAAAARGIPHIRLTEQSLVQLGFGSRAKKIQATTTSETRFIGVEIAGDKDLTKTLLGFHGVPVPKGAMARTLESAIEVARGIGWPAVVKPLDASHGRGINTDIRNDHDLELAFNEAREYRSTVIVEQFISGNDYRLLVVNQHLIAAAQRIPASVVGNGALTIGELVANENKDPRRGEGHEKILTRIKVDEMTEHLLALRGLTLESVPAEGERVFLKTTANLSTGGTAIDVTDRVHPSNIHMAQRISKLVELDICGIDIVSPRIDAPIGEVGGAIVEVNAAPGFRMHLAPTEGKPRPVAEAVVEMLFPRGTESRIPIISVTGTNGKTTTARLCAHIAKQHGRHVGLTTTEGIYVNNELIIKGDCSGPQSATAVLREPAIDFAVLETARGGILRAGLGYDWSDVAVVTNIAADHLGLRDVHTLEDLARVKGVTVERVFPHGCAVLNAEDAMTPFLRKLADCKVALFALDSENPMFSEHVQAGNVGVTIDDGQITLWENGVRVPLVEVRAVPLTFEGRARFNVSNTLAAVAAMYAVGIDIEDIRIGIQTFFPSAAQTPGRMNFFEVRDFTIVLDYAHNPHGLAAVAEFARSLRKQRVIAILGVPGDRRDEDITAAARIAAESFDVVILREDFQTRGRQRGEVAEILRRGMLDARFDPENIHVMPEEVEAVKKAMEIARRDDLVFYFADEITIATRLINELRDRDTATETPTNR
ncbi:MAG TPA: cyanophycin synthetase [Thermoanaerobaculia bacterium]|nr:cyanophycin synthetase [Thermoanaerobaculia bacterium]